jgi:hypothetical protein
MSGRRVDRRVDLQSAPLKKACLLLIIEQNISALVPAKFYSTLCALYRYRIWSDKYYQLIVS